MSSSSSSSTPSSRSGASAHLSSAKNGASNHTLGSNTNGVQNSTTHNGKLKAKLSLPSLQMMTSYNRSHKGYSSMPHSNSLSVDAEDDTHHHLDNEHGQRHSGPQVHTPGQRSMQRHQMHPRGDPGGVTEDGDEGNGDLEEVVEGDDNRGRRGVDRRGNHLFSIEEDED